MKKLALGFLISVFSANALASKTCHSLFELARPSEDEINVVIQELYHLKLKVWEGVPSASILFKQKYKELSLYLPKEEIDQRIQVAKQSNLIDQKQTEEQLVHQKKNSQEVLDQVLVKNFLLEHNMTIDSRGPNQEGILSFAISKDRIDMLEPLLKLGANIETTDREGSTPFMIAADNKKIEAMHILKKAGINIDATGISGKTAFFRFLESRKSESLIKSFLDLEPDINKPRFDRESPLAKAASWASGRIMKMLIDAGADVHYKGKNNFPLSEASAAGNLEAARVLLENKANVNDRGLSQGRTALMLAVLKEKIEMVNLLIESGADVNLTDNNSKTALQINNEFNEDDAKNQIREILLKAGAKE